LVSSLKSYFEKIGDEGSFAEKVWVGAADFPEDRWQRYKATSVGQPTFTIEPIFTDQKVFNKYYNGFCNATLWPLFHYFPSYVEFNESTYQSYEEVNQCFANKLLSIIGPGDVVWIHDYHLMILPSLIRERVPDISIGFFLHIPFPSYEIFRMLHRPSKEKIVQGLLGADLIGFHTYEYVQHFLKTVRMVAGYDSEYRTISLKERTVKADQFPLGIDFEKFNTATRDARCRQQIETIQSNFGDRKIIFSVDRLDYTKGITHRLSGFERFLELYPAWREQIVFILVVVPSRQIVSKYNERLKLIEEQVGSINGKFSTLSWQPILYRYNKLDFFELSALYNTAHIALITPLRDGMNLVAKEYVASKTTMAGVLILSELAGAANELGEALLVNPTDREEVAEAIASALMMPLADQQQSMALMQQRLKSYDVVNWVGDFLRQLDELKELQHSQQTRFITKKVISAIKDRFERAEKRLLFLDYDGTLVPFARKPQSAAPLGSTLEVIRGLTEKAHTDVVIISGRDSSILEKWFEGIPVHLVAEHGSSIKLNGHPWLETETGENNWKDAIRPTLELFAARSPGSIVEEKNHSLAWHYRMVDLDLGFLRSRELLDNLYNLIRNSNLNILDGNKVVEVKEAGINKGVATARIIDMLAGDFILAIGDDKTDEDMFKALIGKGMTIKVGTDVTAAEYNLHDQLEVIRLLQELTSVEQ
jgi:trehalose 6-phosphate synthase/phosphatase